MLTYEEKAIALLKRLRMQPPGKQWRDVGYFSVPGKIMRTLADEGRCEMRKKHAHSPTEYRPTWKE